MKKNDLITAVVAKIGSNGEGVVKIDDTACFVPFALIGEKEKTEFWVEKIVDEAFSPDEEGFPGDEDNGSMAGWYVFACLGFYPVCPGKNEYAYSKPLFNEIKINK